MSIHLYFDDIVMIMYNFHIFQACVNIDIAFILDIYRKSTMSNIGLFINSVSKWLLASFNITSDLFSMLRQM
jgi:hypothetical protein